MQQGTIHIEKQLFQSIASGSEAAFTELFHLYTPRLYPFVRRLTRSDEQAKEMVQETFLQLWINREQLREVENPTAWIYRIASNLSLNWLRNEANRRRLIEENIINSTVQETNIAEAETRQLQGIISKAVEALPEKRRLIYRMSREEGLSHQQIANKLQLSVQTVKNQLGISLQFIQEFIHKETGLSLLTLVLLFTL